jgi:hypothetical protein
MGRSGAYRTTHIVLEEGQGFNASGMETRQALMSFKRLLALEPILLSSPWT